MNSLSFLVLISALTLRTATAQRLIALDGGLGDGVPGMVERVLGEDAVIPIVLLRADAEDKPVLNAAVMLSGGSLAAPMGIDVAFQPAKVATHPALLEGSLTLPSPDTTQSLTQIVTLYGASEDLAKPKVASFALHWVSATECRTALLMAVAEDDRGRSRELKICGALPGLREQLRAWKVPFEDLHKDLPRAVDSDTIFIASDISEDARLPEIKDRASVLLFYSRPGRGLEVLRKNDRFCLTQVWLQGLPNWKQSAVLLRLLTEHLQHATPANSP